MTYEMMIEAVEALGADASYWEDEEEKVVYITFRDFYGFDDDWSEMMRSYDDAEGVKAFKKMLVDECASYDEDYDVYSFDGFEVEVDYASSDI